MTLLAFAATCRAAAAVAAVDRYLLLAGPTTANPPQRHTIDGTDRHRAITQSLQHTTRAVSLKQSVKDATEITHFVGSQIYIYAQTFDLNVIIPI